MLKKKYYDGFTVHDILNKHLDDGHKILELLTAFADADGVDAVEVIRCKDCKHLRIVNSQELAAVCSFHCYKFEPFEDDYRECFCSWAERKEE